MKVLIGTPVHVSKDYSMRRWLKNVSQLTAHYAADILMVDNSPDPKYCQKVDGYCKAFGIHNYNITHLEITQGEAVDKNIDEQIHERVAYCQELIRHEVLTSNYDVWFSWECDQIIPVNSLDVLIDIMILGNFLMVNHNCWDKHRPGELCFDFGVTLVNREYLEKYSFLLDPSDPDVPDTWYNAQTWYKRRMIRNNDRFTDVFGVLNPVLHLNK